MSIITFPKKVSGDKSFDELVTFHSLEDPNVFYQRFHVPLTVITMDSYSLTRDDTVMTFYTPDAIYELPFSCIKGRPTNSQHQHNVFEFTYILSGDMYQIVEGKRYYYPKGSCCLMNRNTLHTEEHSTEFTCLFITVSAELISKILSHEKDMLFSEEIKSFHNIIFDFFSSNLEKSDDEKDFLDFTPKTALNEQMVFIKKIFDDMIEIMSKKEKGSTYEMLSLFMRFVDTLCDEKYYSSIHMTAKSSMDSLLFSRIDRILSQYHGRITHNQLAKMLNYNGSYLGRIVKKYTGKSLFDYSMTFSMSYAAELLSKSSNSITEIANELHFTNYSHFYKIFEEQFGLTPKEYRLKNSKK